MINNNILNNYLEAFRHLSVKVTNGIKAPNKAIMLMSVIDLIRLGYSENDTILMDHILVDAFTDNWQLYIKKSNVPSPWTPFWHLKSESFWHFMPKRFLSDIDALVGPDQTASFNQMRSVISYAYLDVELFNLLEQKGARDLFYDLLTKYYIEPYNKSNSLIDVVSDNAFIIKT